MHRGSRQATTKYVRPLLMLRGDAFRTFLPFRRTPSLYQRDDATVMHVGSQKKKRKKNEKETQRNASHSRNVKLAENIKCYDCLEIDVSMRAVYQVSNTVGI